MGCLNSTAASESQMAKLHQSGPGYTYYATSAYPPPLLPGHAAQEFGAAFLRRQGPTGMTWAQYVQGGACYVDSRGGLLAGPWAECIEAAVHFEHTVDFSRLPEYARGEGPAGQVLMSLEQWLGVREDRKFIMEAAERLEERAHEIADHGSPESAHQPYTVQSLGGSAQPCGIPCSYGFSQPCDADPHAYARPSYTPGVTQMQQPYMTHAEPSYTPGLTHLQQPSEPYAPEHGYIPGPTLLQQPVQNQGGMSTGAKVALGVGAAAVGVAGGVVLASHADEIGDALGGVAGWAEEGVEDIGEFVDDMF